MVWQDWWPHDPQPVITRTDPYLVHVEKNKVYWWCACGKSKNQPWCDGNSHRSTGLKPLIYIPSFTGRKLMCGCKQGGKRPLCNGNHLWLKCHQNTPKASAAIFTIMFLFGVTSTYLLHP
ncbi:zinc finger CDGSH-type domain-containing protein [Cardiosporidium cionae]|uniref:Zinc finger CDGSH-type domain-containing protein n=1 Tax=Cardiosporidium cionae TaxID=476202 RepID=A0ABQ7JFV4_9APIC|nr:zinc finger CDGSH-type domain-containing protein [Cardiosporidium cionae]|eukprot:KAF8822866.1 zinc finger CDGSH-type domain-containing protein [Cardiosporidium cionae]